MIPALATIVKQHLKKVKEKDVPFYCIYDKATKRGVVYAANIPGKAAVFGNLTKINAHLKKKGKGEEEFPSNAAFCAGTVARNGEGVLTFNPTVKKGMSGAALAKRLSRLNTEAKIGLSQFELYGGADEVEDTPLPTVPEPEEVLEEEEEEEVESEEEPGPSATSTETPTVPPPTPTTTAETTTAPENNQSAPPPPDPAYVKAKDDATKAIAGLKKHTQKAYVNTEITQADQKFLVAEAKVASDLPGAIQGHKDVKTLCDAALAHADAHAVYVSKRGMAGALVKALKGVAQDSWHTTLLGQLTAADNLEAAPGRKHAEALVAIKDIRTEASAAIKRWYVDGPKTKIDGLKTQPAAAFVDKDLKELEKMNATVGTRLAAEEFSGAILTGRRLSSQIDVVAKIQKRRANYETARALTRAAIDKLDTGLVAPIQAQETALLAADALATREAVRFEEGIAALKVIDAECVRLTQAAIEMKGYKGERPPVEQKLSTLKTSPNAAHLAKAIAAVEGLLQEAATQATANNWAEARDLIGKAGIEAASANAIGVGLGETATAAGLAEHATTAEERNHASSELKKRLADLLKSPHQTLIGADLERARVLLDASASSEDQNGAIADLKAAGVLLLGSQTMHLQHEHYLAERLQVEARGNAVKSLPAGSKVSSLVDAVTTELGNADRLEAARDFPGALGALRVADHKAFLAEEGAKSRAKFDTRYDALVNKKDALATGPGKTKVTTALDAAKVQADKCAFGKAKTFLDQAEAGLNSIDLDKKVRAGTITPEELTAKADEIMKLEGGGKQLDELVAALPTTVSYATIKKLAKSRFGLEFDSDALDDVASGKKIWEMLAKVPEDHVRNNPSMVKVQRKGPDSQGGYYSPSENLVVINGRPATSSDQGFGTGIPGELPSNVADNCKPVDNNPVPYFDFATLHEVGHAVDDRLNFMGGKAGQGTFGGWESLSDLGPVAKAVATAKKYDEGYVLALLLGKDPVPVAKPSTDPRSNADWENARLAVVDWYTIATNESLWWNHGQSANIAINGVVYQEAYKKSWVAYNLAARSQGITGYQFRAPGEWFAELYASYHSKKLKEGHPAVQWLKTL